MMNIRDLPLFSAADAAAMRGACQRLAQAADGVYRTKHQWALIGGCSEHAVSARFSELRQRGYVVERRSPEPERGEVVGIWWYQLRRP